MKVLLVIENEIKSELSTQNLWYEAFWAIQRACRKVLWKQTFYDEPLIGVLMPR